ncbi:hypothetical protein Dimus_005749 [Dionaea muscipula]
MENGIWWLGSGESKRRDEVKGDLEEESDEKDSTLEEEEETNGEQESTPVGTKGDCTDGTKEEKSDSKETFFDAVDNTAATDEDNVDTDGHTQQCSQMKSGQSTTIRGVDPSSTGHDYQLIHLQAQLHQAKQENAGIQELLKQHQQNLLAPPTNP